MRCILPLLIILLCARAQAATVDTIRVYSQAMKKEIPCVVIVPAVAAPDTRWPVVYLLHGYSGSYNNWIRKVPELAAYADRLGIMIVCPDGDVSSWYFDSPLDPSKKYETYIGKEVPAFIDAHYPTVANRYGRAITGLSMGGHGGLFIGFRHASLFGACGSMSGGVNLKPLGNKYDIARRIGDTIAYKENWKKYSVINVVEQYPQDSIAIIIDCGTDDFFYNDNKALHEKMLRLRIPHDYIERPGKHDWNYWRNAVEYQLVFFRRYFDDAAIFRK